MAYRLPKKSRKGEFVINYGEEQFNLPFMSNLPMSFLVRIQAAQAKTELKNKRMSNEGQVEMMQVFMDILEKYAPSVAADITTTQFEELMDAWNEASTGDEEGEDLGES